MAEQPTQPPPGVAGDRRFLLRHWEGAAALVAVGLLYALLSSSLRVSGPRGLLLAAGVVATVAFGVLHWRGLQTAARWVGLATTAAVALMIVNSVRWLALLPSAELPSGRALFLNAAAIWLLNVLVFAIWYWQIDGGGPGKRHAGAYRTTDFAFPQFQLDDPAVRTSWQPSGVDYLFLAFNTSTAFSPADTMVMSVRAKVLMMLQAVTSLVIAAVLVSRAVGSL